MRSPRSRATVLAIAVLAAILAVVPSTAPTSLASPRAGPGPAPAGVVRPAGTAPVPHAALASSAPAPTAAAPPGEQFGAAYEVQVPNYTSALGSAVVDVPSVLVRIPSSTGALHLYLDAVNVSVTSANPVNAGAVPLTRFAAATTFNASGAADLSSQGIAVMASWPYGGPAVEFRWHWTSVGPDGSTGTGAWSTWGSVEPAELASLGGPVARSWTVGAPYELCLTGALAGRTFALHLATTSPASQIDAGSATAPTGAAPRLCWNNTVPASTSPQSAVVHLWETDNTTFLLYVFTVQLAAPSSSSPAPQAGGTHGPSMTTVAVGVGAALVVIALLGYVFVVRPRKRRRQGPGVPPPLVADPPARETETPPTSESASHLGRGPPARVGCDEKGGAKLLRPTVVPPELRSEDIPRLRSFADGR